MVRRSRNALSARRMPIAPVWNPEGGLLTKTRLWGIWCYLRGHKTVMLVDREEATHDGDHRVMLTVCLRCGFPDSECLNCDWQGWEDYLE